MVGDADFADIVHRAGEKDLINERFIHTQHRSQLAAVIADALHMGAGVFILVFRRPRHRENHFQIAFLKIGGAFLHSLFQHVILLVQRFMQQAHFQHAMNSRQHITQIKRFADEILGAGPERTQLVIRLRGNHQHRKVAVRFNLLKRLHHLEAIHAGHLKIEQDQVVAVFEVQPTDLARNGRGGDDNIAVAAQHPFEQKDIDGLIVHNQDVALKNVR